MRGHFCAVVIIYFLVLIMLYMSGSGWTPVKIYLSCIMTSKLVYYTFLLAQHLYNYLFCSNCFFYSMLSLKTINWTPQPPCLSPGTCSKPARPCPYRLIVIQGSPNLSLTKHKIMIKNYFFSKTLIKVYMQLFDGKTTSWL